MQRRRPLRGARRTRRKRARPPQPSHLHRAVLGRRLCLLFLDEGVRAQQLLLHLAQQRHRGVLGKVHPLHGTHTGRQTRAQAGAGSSSQSSAEPDFRACSATQRRGSHWCKCRCARYPWRRSSSTSRTPPGSEGWPPGPCRAPPPPRRQQASCCAQGGRVQTRKRLFPGPRVHLHPAHLPRCLRRMPVRTRCSADPSLGLLARPPTLTAKQPWHRRPRQRRPPAQVLAQDAGEEAEGHGAEAAPPAERAAVQAQRGGQQRGDRTRGPGASAGASKSIGWGGLGCASTMAGLGECCAK